jgi:hypothetical protein
MAKFRTLLCVLALVALAAGPAFAASLTESLKAGKADLKSAGALAFGPEAILFVGDSVSGAVFALDTNDRTASQARPVDIKGINEKVAAVLGTAADQVMINDVIVNPISKKIYLSVSRGRGPTAVPVILRVDAMGKIEEVALDNIKHARAALPNPPANREGNRNPRLEAITDLAYVEGKILVAGLTNEEFASNLRSIPFPFQNVDTGASIEIFHGAHGRFETNSPVRTFVPYTIKQEQHILAAYTCTPLVKLPLSSLKPGSKVMGTTIAELGNGNRPIDMIVYKKNGQDYILMANNSRGVMKLSTANIDNYKPITAQTDITGVPYETIQDLKGVVQLDSYDANNALILMSGQAGSMDLKTVALP